jgi:hypothetical protein
MHAHTVMTELSWPPFMIVSRTLHEVHGCLSQAVQHRASCRIRETSRFEGLGVDIGLIGHGGPQGCQALFVWGMIGHGGPRGCQTRFVWGFIGHGGPMRCQARFVRKSKLSVQ